jgi:hypothetical protein
MIAKSQPKFSLGQIVATPGGLESLRKADQTAVEFVQRHSVQSATSPVSAARMTA